jgi:hypothetical protein
LKSNIFFTPALMLSVGLALFAGVASAQEAASAVSHTSSASAATDTSSAPPAPGADSSASQLAAAEPVLTQDKRAFGVLPNYRTVEGSIPFSPLTTRQKFTIATKDTIDGPSYILAGIFSGISQMTNAHPSFGQGLEGYMHRYGTAIADQDIGNFMTEAIMPTLLHEDPRYFRNGQGSVAHRIGYAVSRVAVAKTDKGNATFNFSEFLGNGVTGAIGNAYYPDEVGFGDTMQRMFTQIGTDSISNVLKEFWPDIKRKYFNKHHT